MAHQPHQPKTTPVEHSTPDAWHDHAHDAAPMHAHAENVDVPRVMAIGVALFVAVVISVVAVYGLYKWFLTNKLAAQEVTTPGAPALLWRAEKDKQIQAMKAGQTRVIKGGEGVPDRSITVRPLEEAMSSVIEQYRRPDRTAAAPAPESGAARN